MYTRTEGIIIAFSLVICKEETQKYANIDMKTLVATNEGLYYLLFQSKSAIKLF